MRKRCIVKSNTEALEGFCLNVPRDLDNSLMYRSAQRVD